MMRPKVLWTAQIVRMTGVIRPSSWVFSPNTGKPGLSFLGGVSALLLILRPKKFVRFVNITLLRCDVVRAVRTARTRHQATSLNTTWITAN